MNIADVEQCALDTKREALKMKKSPEKIEELISAISELGMVMADERSEREIEQERIEAQHEKERKSNNLILKTLMENADQFIGAQQNCSVHSYKENNILNISKLK